MSASYKQVTATKKFVMEAGRPVGCWNYDHLLSNDVYNVLIFTTNWISWS